MATLISIADGNASAAATWAVVDATSFLDSEAGSTLNTTSYVYTANFTPGAITTDGIAVKCANRVASPSGTISIELFNDTGSLSISTVTINASDFANLASLNHGWVFFKFSAPVLLSAATNYKIGFKGSVASQVSLYRNATAGNWSRMLRTTTTAAPAANDSLHIMGEWTAAATRTNFTVTWDITATTSFGTTTPPQSITVNGGGTLTAGTTAATNYNLKFKGVMQVFAGGTLNIGTVGTPMPSDSTFTMTFDSAVNVDTGLVVSDLGTLIGRGFAKTYVKCFLNADASAAATALTTDVSTGWKNGDSLAIASTSRTLADNEKVTMGADASGTSIPTITALGAAHSGTSPTQAEVANLTRNVKITGASSSLQGYVFFTGNCTIDLEYLEFNNLGSNTTNKRGINYSPTGTSTLNMCYCSIHDFGVSGSQFLHAGATLSSFVLSYNNWHNITSSAIIIGAITTTNVTIDNNLFITSSVSSTWSLSDVGGTFTNNTVAGGGQPFIISEAAVIGTISGLVSHGCQNVAQILLCTGGTVSNITAWRHGAGTAAWQLSSAINNVTIDGYTAFGNSQGNLSLALCSNCTINNFVSNGDTSFATTQAVTVASSQAHNIIFNNADMSTVGGIKTAHTRDINCDVYNAVVYFYNSKFGASTEVTGQSLLRTGSRISSQKHGQTAGVHKTWKPEGTITIDSTIYNTASPSIRQTPLSASLKLSSCAFSAAVANGTALTVGVSVRESVVGDGTDYNGNRIRLIVKKNVALGIDSDTVLATATIASEGAWEAISGTTATVTDDGILEFAVDCDGTTGWINADDWTCNNVVDTKGMKYWKDGQAFAYHDNGSGGAAGARLVGPSALITPGAAI